MAASGLGGEGGGEQEERREGQLWLVCKMNKINKTIKNQE